MQDFPSIFEFSTGIKPYEKNVEKTVFFEFFPGVKSEFLGLKTFFLNFYLCK